MTSFAASLSRFKKRKFVKSADVHVPPPQAEFFSALVAAVGETAAALSESDLWVHFREAGGVTSVRLLPINSSTDTSISSPLSRAVVTFSTLRSLRYATHVLDGALLWGSSEALAELTRSNGNGGPVTVAAAAAAEDCEGDGGSSGCRIRVVALPLGADPATYPIPTTEPSPSFSFSSLSSADVKQGQPSQPEGQLPNTPLIPRCQGGGGQPDIVVGGVGGSGTRLIALCLEALGFSMGHDQVSFCMFWRHC